ncbi:MAG: BTAD domain-containing putative transcriptional regulator [Ilumatobacteraceae bacterium]
MGGRVSGRGEGIGQQPFDESSTLQIALFDGFKVWVRGTAVPDSAWRAASARGLVKALALAPNHQLHREQLVDMLWPDIDPEGVVNRFRSALHTARQALEPGRAGGTSTYVRRRNDMLSLWAPAGVRVDVDAFRAAAARCRHHSDVRTYSAAVDLYAGELLPEDRYRDWAAAARESLRETWIALMLELGRIHEERGELAEGIAVLERVIDAADAQEDAHAGLMRLKARAGRPGQAMRQYARLRDTLARDLNVSPMASTTELHAAIAGGRLEPDRGTNPTERSISDISAARRRSLLPIPLDRFIGRADEICVVADLLDDTRLLTLTGVGGGGKTRLAIEVASRVIEVSTDEVRFVELGRVRDPTRVAGVVAEAIGVSGAAQPEHVARMTATLGDGRTLLVLDNCEHLIGSCVELVGDLLASCPGLRVLATSREPLRMSGEVTWRIPPLTLPPVVVPIPSPTELADVARSEAVRLIVDRIRAVRPGFELTAGSASALARICRRLDGLPLAIELAAARMSTLSPDQLAERLDAALQVLISGSRSLPERQRTLRAALDWSHALLDPVTAALFRRLAVFAGGWTLEAAEVVCVRGPGFVRRTGTADEGFDVLEALSQLVDKSMVQVDEAPSREDGMPRVRYTMLETVRQYALEQLERSDDHRWIRDRHARFFTRVAVISEGALSGPEQVAWRARLDRDHDNLRAALRRSVESGNVVMEARLCAPLWRYWHDGGHLTEGDSRFSAAIARSGGRALPPLLQARLLYGSAVLTLACGDVERALPLADSALELMRSTGDKARLAATFHLMGNLSEVRNCGDAARRSYIDALRIRESIGDATGAAATLHNLGNVARHELDPAAAVALYEQSLVLNRSAGNERGVAMNLANLGEVALDLGDHRAALRHAEQSLRLDDRLATKQTEVVAMRVVAFARLYRGEMDRAADAAVSCLRIGADVGDQRAVVLGLEAVAAVVGAGHGLPDAQRSAELFGAAEAIRRRVDMLVPACDTIRLVASESAGRAALGDRRHAEARAAGSRLSMDAAIALALGPTEVGPLPETHGIERPLTGRQREVAELIATGMTNAQISARLGITHRTVDTHVSTVLGKLGVTSRTGVGGAMQPSTYT